MEWRKINDHEWWLVFEDAPDDLTKPDDNGISWPPSMTISWVGFPSACCHLYKYYNGANPGEDSEDVDYIHICDPKDFIKDLESWIITANYVGEN